MGLKDLLEWTYYSSHCQSSILYEEGIYASQLRPQILKPGYVGILDLPLNNCVALDKLTSLCFGFLLCKRKIVTFTSSGYKD